MRYPAAIPAFAICAGIFAGILVPPDVPLRIAPLALVVLWALACGALLARRGRAAMACLIAGFCAAGFALGRHADSSSRQMPLRAVFDRHLRPGEHQVFATVQGRLAADAVKSASGVTLDIDVERIELEGTSYHAAGGALVSIGGALASDRNLQWRAGRRVAFPAILRRPTRYFDAGVPDGERQLAWRGTALVGSVKSDALVELLAYGSATSEAFASARAAVRAAVASSIGRWSDRSAAIVLAILIGDRTGLTEDVERRLQEAGTYHVIAISGGNIAIFAALCVWTFRAARLGPRASALVTIGVLTTYALCVQGGSSVARATLMAAIYFAALAADHRTPPLNTVALTAAMLLCVDPLQGADAGFALTFGATLGILAGMALLEDVVGLAGWRRAPVALAAASLCAEVALLPVSAFVFSRITFAGLIVNFAAIPLMSIVQVAGMAAVAACWCVPALAAAAGWIAHVAVECLLESAVLVDWLPWLARRVAPPSSVVVAVYYAALATIAISRRITPATRRRVVRWVASVTFAASLACIVAAPSPASWQRTNRLRVTFLDVGQGDSCIVQFPGGRTLGIDAGGTGASSFDIAGRVVSPALWALGVRRLDYMSITHGDVDHIGGAAGLFRDFRPLEIWDGVPVPPHTPTRELRALADAAGTPWRTLQPGDRMRFGDVELLVHHPPTPDWERQRVRNDDSEVIEIRYGEVSFVFTGDISREVEQAIADGFSPAGARILKVPHHGSATSSSQMFLDALRPDIAVISAGRGNPFGHPVAPVLERYRNAGAAIYRTDRDGAVTIETDGRVVRVRTFRGRTLTLSARR